jgi:flagellar biosynthesis GTPase FlhF
MDIIFLLSLASGLIVVICIVALIKQRTVKVPETAPARGVPVAQGHERQIPRRAVGARNARARLRAVAHPENEIEQDEVVQNLGADIELSDGKIGAKKRAKLEAKAERKAQREAEEKSREEKKKRQEQEEEERLKAVEKEKQEEEQRLEAEMKARLEKERQEHEEYLKLKAAFSVEEEGYEEDGEEEQNSLLQEFINYIKNMKVVVLEDLAAHFKLKTQNVIDRIQVLQAEGLLTGVVDDRGKFIYISPDELEAVAKFIKQRGRVSIAELAESSNKLINLNPNINKSVSVQN